MAAAAPTRKGNQTSDRLGLNELTEENYKAISEINGYKYETPPGFGYSTRDSIQKFTRLAGAFNPIPFTVETFDQAREKMQILEKKEKQSTMEAMALLYTAKCGEHFSKNKKVDHAEFERMLNPNYAPRYADAVRALDLPQKMWWTRPKFEALENLSRIPLHTVDIYGKAELSFEEWYQLFWNYAMPFNPVAFYSLINSQPMVYTKEFVEELAKYLLGRLSGEVKHDGQPILHYGDRVGKLAKLINDTKILPVEVIAADEDPARNPYFFLIPDHCQKKFKPAPIEKLKLGTAIEKYKPSVVLLSNMKTQKDITQDVRAFGCVQEYLTIGLTNSNIEGHGWDTWAEIRYIDREEAKKSRNAKMPAYFLDGYKKWMLHNVSRYAIHKYDQKLSMGHGAVVSFHRKEIAIGVTHRLKWLSRRIATRF